MIQFNVMFRTGDKRRKRKKSVGIGKSSQSWSGVRFCSGVDNPIVGRGWYTLLVDADGKSDGEPSVGRGYVRVVRPAYLWDTRGIV